MLIQRECKVCDANAVNVSCSECEQAYYCSTSHQEAHWAIHKTECQPSVIERKDPIRGRYFIAGRDVAAGELLFRETPIALGPRATSRPMCLGCHELIPNPDFIRCPVCSWPLCSIACASSKLHEAECPILAADTERLGQPKNLGNSPCYDIILVLRCLLLRGANPTAWVRLLLMASHAERLADDEEKYHMATVYYINDVLKVNFEPKFTHHARGAIMANCFEWSSLSDVRIRGVYPKTGRINHSCLPNVTLSTDCNGVMFVRAAIDLKALTPLYITYTEILIPIWERQAHILKIHYFTCDCSRCDDSTELGLHYSSPKCKTCKLQFMEPKTSLETTIWECPTCHVVLEGFFIRKECSEWMAKLSCNDMFSANPQEVIGTLEKVEEAFHSTHHVWVMAVQTAIKTLESNESRESWMLRRDLWKKLLCIYDVLEPGMTQLRGATMYELGLCLMSLARTEMKEGRLTYHCYKQSLNEAFQYIEKSLEILSLEPYDSANSPPYRKALQIAETMKQDQVAAEDKSNDTKTPQIAETMEQDLLTSEEEASYTKALQIAETIKQELEATEDKANDTKTPQIAETMNQDLVAEEDKNNTSTQSLPSNCESQSLKMTREENAKCGSCGRKASLKCTACGTVYYCSKEHQKKHWKVHKGECLQFTEECDPQQGRYLVASRDLPAGQLIFKEKPIAFGPAAISPVLCLGCHTPVTTPDYPKCPECSWPLCSADCAKSILHVLECKYLATDVEKHGPPTSIKETPRYDAILVLRCLALRSVKPDAWKTIEKMVSHSAKYEEEQEPYHMTTVQYVTEHLKDVCDAKTAHHVRGSIITNAINTRGPHGQTIRGLYPKIYLLNHSCTPNVTLRSDVYSTLFIHAAKDIKKGDPLVFSYVPSGVPVWQRQEDLKNIYNFTCTCKRCTDPTELGTYFSNPMCSKCKKGYMEPSDSYTNPWKCSSCGAATKLDEISKADDKFIETIAGRCSTFTDASKLLREVMDTYHPKHYVWLRVAQTILGKLGSEKEKESLSMRRDLWQQVLQLFWKLEPGLTRRRGVSLYHEACLETELFNEEKATGKMSPQEQLVAVTKILYLLESAHEILALEPSNSIEERWRKLINTETDKMKKIRDKLEDRR